MPSILKSVGVDNIQQSAASIIVAGATATLTCIGLNVSNTSTANLYATIQLKRGPKTFSILTKGLVPPGNSLSAIGSEGKIVAMPNDEIRAFNDVGTMDIILSYLEQTP
jgi:hypothetical protein